MPLIQKISNRVYGYHWNPHILGHTFKISQNLRLFFKISENHPTSLRFSTTFSDTFKESHNTGFNDGLPWIETLSVTSRSRCLLTRNSVALIRVSYGAVMICRSFLFWGGIDEEAFLLLFCSILFFCQPRLFFGYDFITLHIP